MSVEPESLAYAGAAGGCEACGDDLILGIPWHDGRGAARYVLDTSAGLYDAAPSRGSVDRLRIGANPGLTPPGYMMPPRPGARLIVYALVQTRGLRRRALRCRPVPGLG
jgi:hypothetical protein